MNYDNCRFLYHFGSFFYVSNNPTTLSIELGLVRRDIEKGLVAEPSTVTGPLCDELGRVTVTEPSCDEQGQARVTEAPSDEQGQAICMDPSGVEQGRATRHGTFVR